MMIEAPLGIVVTIAPPMGVSGLPYDIRIPGPCEVGWDRGTLIVISPPGDYHGYRSRDVSRWEDATIHIIAPPAPTEPEQT